MAGDENQYTPDVVSPPGETLAEALAERNMTRAELAQRIGMTRRHVKRILDGDAPITPHTALELERALGIPARFWNNRQRQFARAKSGTMGSVPPADGQGLDPENY